MFNFGSLVLSFNNESVEDVLAVLPFISKVKLVFQ